jgi:hypothetical protein
MKTIIKILIIIWIFSSLFTLDTNAWAVKISELSTIGEIKNVTINKEWTWNVINDVKETWFSILNNFKIVLEWILLIYVVYAGATMIMSMWSDDSKLTKAKTQLRYSLLAIVFINVPWTIYLAINNENGWKNIWSDAGTYTESLNTNLFIDLGWFGNWILSYIISAMEVLIFAIAIYVIVMAGIKIMTSRWRDEKITEAKGKILYSFFALIFVWFMEAWKQFAVKWDLTLLSWEDWKAWIFWKIIDIALLFAWPTVIVFLSIAGYYYITSNWDEEKAKKAKNIVINTLIAIVLLLVMVVFLNDLITLWDSSKIIN